LTITFIYYSSKYLE